MDEVKREFVRTWLIKARNDLDTARQISASPDGHLDTAIYHCQQAAEKAVKGFLACHDHRLERSHDVERLADLARAYEPEFSAWADAAIALTPYASAFRYPGQRVELEPDRPEFDRALALATALLAFVLSRLPSEVHPP